jgi:aspartate/methionine/tyrosine aminotransferase
MTSFASDPSAAQRRDPSSSRFNPLVAGLAPPPIPSVHAWGRAYSGGLGSLIDLSQAVPGYPPHPDLLEGLARAGRDAASASYGPIEGDDALRRAFARDQSALYGRTIEKDAIHITAGCNQAFAATALAIAGPGSKLLVTNPFYFNHETTLKMFGIGVGLVEAPAERGFLPDPAALEAAITPEAWAFAIVSPNNPTGAIYPPDLLEALYDVCRRRGVWLILDETYRDFLPPGAPCPHRLFARPGWDQTLVSLFSFSKSYCVPGYRVGAVTASPRMVAEIAKIMDNLQICAPRIGQIALAEALPRLDAWKEGNRGEIAARAAKLRQAIADAPGWAIGAVGAYFAFIRHPFRDQTSASVAERLAREVGVVTVPGSYFGPGQEDHLRFAFANAGGPVIERVAARLRAL